MYTTPPGTSCTIHYRVHLRQNPEVICIFYFIFCTLGGPEAQKRNYTGKNTSGNKLLITSSIIINTGKSEGGEGRAKTRTQNILSKAQAQLGRWSAILFPCFSEDDACMHACVTAPLPADDELFDTFDDCVIKRKRVSLWGMNMIRGIAPAWCGLRWLGHQTTLKCASGTFHTRGKMMIFSLLFNNI